MATTQSLHNNYKTCPQCGQSLPLIRFVVYQHGDESYPVIASLCDQCRQDSLNEQTRSSHENHLDLDYEDLWIRMRKRRRQWLEDQLDSELDDKLQQETDDQDRKQELLDSEKDKKQYHAGDDRHELDTDESIDADKKISHNTTVDYDYNALKQYNNYNIAYADRLINMIANAGINIAIIDPFLISKLIHENPEFNRLFEFFSELPGAEHNIRGTYQQTRQDRLKLNNSQDNNNRYQKQLDYAIKLNRDHKALFDFTNQHQKASSLRQQTYKKQMSSGLFGNHPANQITNNQTTGKTKQTSNSLFSNNPENSQQEESELTNFLKKTWGKP